MKLKENKEKYLQDLPEIFTGKNYKIKYLLPISISLFQINLLLVYSIFFLKKYICPYIIYISIQELDINFFKLLNLVL
jgi:hypothetical protein